MAGVLDGVRVVDFGQYIAGPLAAQLLADQGADVIRVDPPGGPRWQTPANATWNRGKRSIALDLVDGADREIARSLIAHADVLIENFRPGVMDRLQLGAAALTNAHPQLIYCSLPGFAPDDPRADVRAWEGVVGAAAGTYRRVRVGGEGGTPVYSALPIASSYAAIQAVVAVTMALAVRDRDGVGQQITVPLFDAMFGAVGYNGTTVHASETPPPGGSFGLTTQFECKDGRWIMFHTGNGRTEQVFEAFGVGAWIAEGMTDRARLAADPALAAELQRRAIALFKTRNADEWEALVAEAGGECAVCRDSAEWIDHPHARGSEIIVEVDDPTYGPMRQAGIPARLSRTPGAIGGPAHGPDADRDGVIGELAALSAPGARAPIAVSGASDATLRAALDGVRVLDFCIVLAGPTCGRTLAEYGADVIKIEAPQRPPGASFHYDVNRAKRSIVLDLKQPGALDVFWRLLESADVVTQNFRRGVAERLGIGYEQVRARRPDIVYASLNTYGHVGPFADRPGHEQIAQAATGMQARYGGNGKPELQRYAVNDYGTGYFGAYAVALALLHRGRTGLGQHVDAALAYTATVLQTPFMQDFAGKTWDEARGQDALGSGPLHRAYEAADGWLFLGARGGDLPALAAIAGLRGVDALAGPALEAALAERFATRDVRSWVADLVAMGIGAHHVVHNVAELMADPWSIEHGLSITREHPGIGLVTTTGPAPRLSRTPVTAGRPGSLVGGDTREVLAQIGWSDQTNALVERGVLVEAGGGG